MSAVEEFDVVIVGGGVAGLSAAVMLARSLRAVVVLDGGEPRNAPSPGVHNLLGREGVSPADLLSAARTEAASYGVVVRRTSAVDARREGDGLVVTTRDGQAYRGRRLLLASGLVDELPDVAGLDRFWGTSVLHCPYCHGWEVRGRRIAVLATGPNATHQALLFSRLSDSVTVVVSPGAEPGAEDAVKLAARGVDLVTGPAVSVIETEGRLSGLALAEGPDLAVDAVVVAPRAKVRGDLYERLGGVLTEHPMGMVVPADDAGRTPVTGVWAAGNLVNPAAVVAVAAAAGVSVGAQLNADLLGEEIAEALTGTVLPLGRS